MRNPIKMFRDLFRSDEPSYRVSEIDRRMFQMTGDMQGALKRIIDAEGKIAAHEVGIQKAWERIIQLEKDKDALLADNQALWGAVDDLKKNSLRVTEHEED